MFVENTFTVIDKQTGRKYDCFEQWINLNYDSKMIHRYIVGINGSPYWTLCCTYYSDEALEKDYCIDFDRLVGLILRKLKIPKKLIIE